MADKVTPLRETDAEARAIATGLIATARIAAPGVVEPETGAPFVSQIAFGLAPDGAPITLISDLALHTQVLRQDPRASLLIAAPKPRGDPMAHPRLTLRVRAHFIPDDAPERPALREDWLAQHPKSRLYVGFADFHLVRFEILTAHLNAGFGKAYALDRNDLKVT
ncbi:MAG: pyridoxamine 5-phosphate oxidase [Albidovulum sp.]|uniref:HugZ family pyridoxamine 5'-phosphate oxidase n=1 Tax=Albidovulum sp. TaxID=1872424 RepID=UPI003C826EA2